MPPARPSRIPHVLLAIYAVVVLMAVTQPGFDRFGNRVEPYVLGLPFVFAWNVFWVAGTFVVLWVYHLSQRGTR